VTEVCALSAAGWAWSARGRHATVGSRRGGSSGLLAVQRPRPASHAGCQSTRHTVISSHCSILIHHGLRFTTNKVVTSDAATGCTVTP